MRLQQQQQRQSTMIFDAIATVNDNSNAISVTTDVHTDKIDKTNRTGILNGILHEATVTMVTMPSNIIPTTAITTSNQSKLSQNSTNNLHDIDRLLLNGNQTINDSVIVTATNNMGNGQMVDATSTSNSRKDLVTIVTISGCTNTESSTGEMDILAHL